MRSSTKQKRSASHVSALADPAPITLTTDFGSADYFVGAVKGTILTINPHALIVDITQEIPAHDVECAAFTILAACATFPAGSIHVAVVDPGVGSSRRAILIRTGGQFFVGPDNGIFSYVCDRSSGSKTELGLFHLDNSEYFRHPVSQTFNGRDVFAPVAAALSLGVKAEELGTPISECVRLPSITAGVMRKGGIEARIIHIDRFGNCVTNITPQQLTAEMIASGAQMKVNGKVVKSFRSFFSEETGLRSKIFGIWGSAGFLEIAAANTSAARLLKAKRGDVVRVQTKQ